MYASLTCTWYEKHIALGLLKIEHFRRQTKKKKKKKNTSLGKGADFRIIFHLTISLAFLQSILFFSFALL